MSIHWFPGHMAKARRLLEDNIKLVDAVIELRDARVPFASANPLLAEIVGDKPVIIALTKPDLADDRATKRFAAAFAQAGAPCVTVNARENRGTKELMALVKTVAEGRVPRDKAKGVALRPVRVMIAGIPNVGKSSLMNSLSGRAAAKTGATPGLTRTKQWITLNSGVEVLDTPGLLWPRMDKPDVSFKLAVTGAVGEGGFDSLELAVQLILLLGAEYPAALAERYKIQFTPEMNGEQLLTELGRRRGCLVSGGQVDLNRAADILLSEFRSGKVGKFTLDRDSDNV